MNEFSKGEISFFKNQKMIVEPKYAQTTYIKNMVSVIITTFNRYENLLIAIESVKKQTYKNIEIIIVNDCSTDERYYNTKFENCNIIHLSENSKTRFGYACPGGYQRNFGLNIARGEYIAFLDDDDCWLEDKLKKQIHLMKKTNCNLSCSNAFKGNGKYNKLNNYQPYFDNVLNYKLNGITSSKVSMYIKNKNIIDYPNYVITDSKLMNLANICICSSVIIHRYILKKVGYFLIGNKSEDYHYWLRVLTYTKLLYIKEPLVYYDEGHGGNQVWSENE